MSSGPNSGLTSSGQMEFENYSSEEKAKQNEEAVAEALKAMASVMLGSIEKSTNTESEVNFFTGPKGQALPAKYKHWIGKSKRESKMRRAKNPKLKEAVNQLYRPGAFIGDGGTASVIKFERATGLNLGRNGNSHTQKGQESINRINKIMKTQNLSERDKKLARELQNDLRKAMRWTK